MTKHTPGPWKVTGELSKHSASVDIHAECGLWVADAKGCHDIIERCGCRRIIRGFPTDEEAVANARLIAAAPDLLEALQFFMAGDLAVGHTAYDKARQAITRATEGPS